MSDSIGKNASCKPPKPYPTFPLFPHDTKRWAKKIKGRFYYFGSWADGWEKAFDYYRYALPFIERGVPVPSRDLDAITIGYMVNSYLESREPKVISGEISQRTFSDSKQAGAKLIAIAGRETSIESLTPDDFERFRSKLGKDVSLVTLSNHILRIKTFFNWIQRTKNIRVNFGESFQKPSRKSIKKEKLSKPAKVFTVAELQALYHAANDQMRCFMLLALNGGLGPSDIGQMESKHVQGAWVRYPRPKTLVDREFPLWKETAKAIEGTRQTEYESELLFITKYSQAWYKDATDSPITKEFAKLLKDCKLTVKQRGFYALRHTFRTVADGCRDRVAIDRVMGHADSSMGAEYREWIEPERLQAVVDHVRKWCQPMFTKPKKGKVSK